VELKPEILKHYSFCSYVTKKRWISYWYQIMEIIAFNPRNVLVIGCGDGIVVDCLKKYGLSVDTFDLFADFNPTYLGSVTEIKSILGAKKYDCILCCQVLEHVPFKDFESIISQLKTLATKSLILSLPQKYSKIEFSLVLKDIKFPKILYAIPKKNRKLAPNGEHCWEIGVKGSSLKQVVTVLNKYFILSKQYAVPENPYHRFFILKNGGL
jgi:hypothetical protein